MSERISNYFYLYHTLFLALAGLLAKLIGIHIYVGFGFDLKQSNIFQRAKKERKERNATDKFTHTRTPHNSVAN